ncbi:hypothetical protein GCM10023149_48630 [Mucilaginibacter gynuensis]|uniref:SPP1 family phage portal protein n=1 Tax=Mucilaginibacter gynuensis TaxID=1302236 RepID=A0ABP8HFA4_9SPHI
MEVENKVTPDEVLQQNLASAPEALQTIIKLIAANDIDGVIRKFKHRKEKVAKALKEYNIDQHEVMKRTDKVLDSGEVITQWKLPIAYQPKIVQSGVAFLFGKPVKFKQESTGTDTEFANFLALRKKMRMASLDAANCWLMKSETESAKLFVEYRDPDLTPEELAKPGVVSLKCILLAKSKGDTLYTLFDIYGVMRAFGRGYKTKNEDDKDVEHFDIYTAQFYYFCTKTNGVWSVDSKVNPVGKIPVAYYWQEWQEWYIVQALIERREMLTSKRADNNDYSGDSILVLEGEVKKLPHKDGTGKVVIMEKGGKASYLYPQMVVDLIKEEREDIRHLIHYLTDTPDLSMDNMATLGQDSGKALEMRFFGAVLKAMSQHLYFEEMIDREVSIMKAFMGKVIDVKSEANLKKLEMSIEFGNPLPDNISDYIDMLSTATGGKPVLSQKTAAKLNPLVQDGEKEFGLIKEEGISSDPENI